MTNETNSTLISANFPKPIRIPVNGVELEVFETGKQNAGKPIVLCHGFPEHAFSWRYQIPALVAAGYHVIIPNQRGYGNSSGPAEVTEYDIEHLTGDLVALLDYFEYKDATFVGHDWGANVVWSLALLHPERVNKVINLALPYQERGEKPWIEFMEAIFGEDFYFVHFNRQPGVADAIMNENVSRFLRNIFRKNLPPTPPEPGMLMINLAIAEKPLGEPLMEDRELSVFVSAFESSGFTGSINWYRNLDRNWHLMANVVPIIRQPTLMIYGEQDTIPKSENLKNIVPNLDIVSLDCGHWIQQEKPEETTRSILKWLELQNNA
ncbi:pimeloyl-ACP methyl ester carboxylesterase [Dyadobacter sp. BE34]|uniref:Pimeloyl-ACP methyl ester carboxylesterase n=1 Tax=Dyadobacter fermentans TaxID=94254 RepID=A0ABU1R0P1_9BACT|nr:MULTISPECIES: alpha/beta hydrolase [Dyadobacter]MDR6806971.1 pimeloyl-ACP methyl ester carboxylesterase [Dyadobacter fermentans]MDR7044713.1 pimeloyl-ACP methyl ester carboxylesterase [Dyadobacter sp. BE242]MDR7199023.1 pimeloyl-ACP methyl ester carboxylesterase [Dyadobacter sp. BE34]MDR7216985.1 pimeloyl-ACP methyl ester carboxylesterase [Dyadobacter sp. BE31]MDR7263489.1 pimeloyl-ACP methyl ester carboxylesterase [Dyadobacter sp. BE32]